jgi:hypothetical protein
MLKRFWSPETAHFLGMWLVFMVGGRSRVFHGPGTFWHTVVGRRILSTGEFMDTDPFSLRLAGKPWIPHKCLGECPMGILGRIGGLDMLLLATATV